MKKTFALLLTAVLLMGLVSCKQKPKDENPDGGAAVTDSSVGGNSETPKETGALESETPADETKTDTASGELAGGEVPATAEKDEITLDEPFTPYDVVVVLTAEESKKNIDYKPSDFPQLDIFNVFEESDYYTQYEPFGSYYRADIHPELADKRILVLMLNEPSKERVLEYVNILKSDPRVYKAEPNYSEIDTRYIRVTLTKEKAQETSGYGYGHFIVAMEKDDFPTLDITGIQYVDNWIQSYNINKDGTGTIFLILTEATEESVMQNVRKALEYDIVKYASPDYSHMDDERFHFILSDERSEILSDVTIDEFPEIDGNLIDEISRASVVIDGKQTFMDYVLIRLKTPDRHVINKISKTIENNPIVKEVRPDYYPSRQIFNETVIKYYTNTDDRNRDGSNRDDIK